MPNIILLFLLFVIGYLYLVHRFYRNRLYNDHTYLTKTISYCKAEHPLVYEERVKKERSGRCLFQTYVDKSKIPQEVFDNIKLYAPEYTHVVMDDYDLSEFIYSYFDSSVLYTFHNLRSGAHKADLARYCLLYIYGGLYMDIKTELIGNLSDIFKDPNTLYTVLSYKSEQIYQGIISSPPKNPFFLSLIDYVVRTQNPWDYLGFCKDFYFQIKADSKQKVLPGENKGSQPYYLFSEKCTSATENMCHDGLDRYGFCCYVWDGDKPIIKTRRASYPWK